MDDEVRKSFMQIWRYASCLIGSPEELLFEGDEAKTNELSRIAHRCEPPPGEESRIIANALVQALPTIARQDGSERRPINGKTCLPGLACASSVMTSRINSPSPSSPRSGFWRRCGGSAAPTGLAPHSSPLANKWRGKNFVFLLEASVLDDLSYRIPDHLRADEATPW